MGSNYKSDESSGWLSEVFPFFLISDLLLIAYQNICKDGGRGESYQIVNQINVYNLLSVLSLGKLLGYYTFYYNFFTKSRASHFMGISVM